jgi:hypothetical protein
MPPKVGSFGRHDVSGFRLLSDAHPPRRGIKGFSGEALTPIQSGLARLAAAAAGRAKRGDEAMEMSASIRKNSLLYCLNRANLLGSPPHPNPPP